MCVNVHEITIQDTSLQIASGQLVLIRWHELTAKGTVMRGCVCVYTTTFNAHNDSHGNAEHTKYKQTATKKNVATSIAQTVGVSKTLLAAANSWRQATNRGREHESV